MRVLQINKFLYRKGGSEEYMFQLTDLLRSQGVECSYWGMADKKNTVTDDHGCFSDNVDFQGSNGLSKLSVAFNSVYSTANAKKIRVILDAFKPDIAHIHNYNFQLTPAILPEIKRHGVRIVHTAHDSQLACPYHRLYNYQRQQICEKCVTGKFHNCVTNKCFDGSLLKSAVGAAESYFYHGLDYYNKYIDAIISPGEFLAGFLRKSVKVPVHVIPNFTKEAQVARAPSPKDYVLYFGRISDEKGILELQHSPLWKDHHLVIVGDGPDKARLAPSENINYLGPKYGDELHQLIANARYVLLPSKCYENCPMTVIESFMCSTPVIASNWGGFKDMIEHGTTGFLIDFQKDTDGKRLRQALETDPKAMRGNCRKVYQQRYAPDAHQKNIMNIYRKVLS